MSTVIELRLNGNFLMEFKAIGKHNLHPKVEPSAPLTQVTPSIPGNSSTTPKEALRLVCQFRYVDLSVLEMVSSASAHFSATAQVLQIHPDCQIRISYFVTNLTASAQDYRFLYEDPATGATYLLHFDIPQALLQQPQVSSPQPTEPPSKPNYNGVHLEQVRLVRLGLVEDEQVGLEVSKRKVESLQRKMTEISDLWDKEIAAIEYMKKEIKELKLQEDALVKEVNDMNGRINLAKAALGEYLKVEDAVRERTLERDKLLKVWNNLAKEGPSKQSEMKKNLSDKFMALRADMTSEYHQRLLEHIEKERKLRASHTAAKSKEATYLSIRRYWTNLVTEATEILKDKQEEIQRLTSMLDLRSKHRLNVKNMLHEDSSYI